MVYMINLIDYAVKLLSQPTLWLYDICMEVLNVYDNTVGLFWAKAFHILYLCRVPEAVKTIFDVLTYDAVLGWDSNLSPSDNFSHV